MAYRPINQEIDKWTAFLRGAALLYDAVNQQARVVCDVAMSDGRNTTASATR